MDIIRRLVIIIIIIMDMGMGMDLTLPGAPSRRPRVHPVEDLSQQEQEQPLHQQTQCPH
jgi:hypothetical protein